MKKSHLVSGWVVSILIPLVLLMTSIRILISPIFLSIEYNMPNFPADTYGFTREDRLNWSRYAVNYLVNSEDIYYLGDLTFPDGTPLYIQSELSHMEDVKKVVQTMILAWIILLVLLLASGVWAWFGKWFKYYMHSLARGGLVTISLVLMIFVFIAIGFSALFSWFHQLFFTEGTWVFRYSDTLIRLFPMRFWQDAFTWVGGLTILFSLGLIGSNKWLASKLAGK